jgi:hypothetical protein
VSALRKVQRQQPISEPAPAPAVAEKPETEIPAATPQPVSAAPTDDSASSEGLAAPNEAVAPPPDDLRKRLDELRQAEQMHHAMLEANMQPEQPRLTEWDQRFLDQRPGILGDKGFHTVVNTMLAHGIRHGSPQWNDILERSFPLSQAEQQETPQQPSSPPPREAPVYSSPPRPMNGAPRYATVGPDDRAIEEIAAVRQAASRGPLVSAPPSRESMSASTGRPSSNTRITLTATERALAHASGISEELWAKGKLELARRKAAGLLQD